MEDGPIIPRFLPLNTALFFGLCTSCIVLVEDDSFGVDFSKLRDDFWQTNGGIPIRKKLLQYDPLLTQVSRPSFSKHFENG
ncbi:unnamed protein product [Acanthoscelides obtectus]|uniref:Uncharacterized protein n=1 Tax=Acanthoscelides obtectus TaxID=200917 RepID=A0A9P0QAS8_ACAOB|nr:unnamed protein product [Acanthoscelides obtectus]CAK1630473.1 hypothetical protein AOBTE_LOCUS6345 [Acanthoscelides obtectus]